MRYSNDGLLAIYSRSEGVDIVKQLRRIGFKYRNGILYSPNWDRQMGYFDPYGCDEFYLNPSLTNKINNEG